MQLTNHEEKYRAAVNLSWSHVQGLRSVRQSEAHQARALIKAAGNH